MALDSSIPVWPRTLAPRTIGYPVLAKPVMAGPKPLAGSPQTVIADTGYWQFQLSGIPISDNNLAQFRSLYNGTLGDGMPVYMRFFDWFRGPRARAGLNLFGPEAGYADGSTYAAAPGDYSFYASAAPRDTTIVVTKTANALADAGDFISTVDGRLHMIVSSTLVSGSRYSWKIKPGLRYAATSGDAIEIADPVCKMILPPSELTKIVPMDLGRIGSVSLNFVEANWTA